jgi:hypothetical protein
MRRRSLYAESREAIADLRGSAPEHGRLYGRLMVLLFAVILAEVVSSTSVYLVEDGKGESDISAPWGAIAWSSSQLAVGGSSLGVTSPLSHAIEVILQILGIALVAALAGSMAAFFHRRDLERDPLRTGR